MRMHSDTQSNAAFDFHSHIIIMCFLQATRGFGCRRCASVYSKMVRIKHIIFFLFIFVGFSVFCPAPSLSTSQSNDNQQPIEITATINQLRFWSNLRYTRVAIDLDNEAPFNFNLTNIRSPSKVSSRFSIDIQNSKLSEKAKRIVEIDDELVTDARLDQLTSNSVRVLIDIKKIKEYKIFSLSNPYRIMIDFWGTASEGSNLSTRGAITKDAITKKFALGVRRICIDPGFGGHEKKIQQHQE